MFSTTQLDVMRPLISDMRDQGYLYYVAHQNQLSGVTNDYDVIIYFSKDEIVATDMYTYTVPKDSFKYSLRTGNASSNYTSQRISISKVNNQTAISIAAYQHISTNATFSTQGYIQPDLFLEVSNYETNGGILFVLCAFVLVYCFIHLFRR